MALLLGGLHQPHAAPGQGADSIQLAANGLFPLVCGEHPGNPDQNQPGLPSDHATKVCDACLLTDAPGLLAVAMVIPTPRLVLSVQPAPRAPPGVAAAWHATPLARGPPRNGLDHVT